MHLQASTLAGWALCTGLKLPGCMVLVQQQHLLGLCFADFFASETEFGMPGFQKIKKSPKRSVCALLAQRGC